MQRLFTVATFCLFAALIWTWAPSVPSAKVRENIEQAHTDSVDLVAFSYDRPIQLYSLLESIEHYVTGLGSTSIIYRTSNPRYAQAYLEVASRFPWARFVKQGKRPEKDFHRLFLKEAFPEERESSAYVMFGVDDEFFKQETDLRDAIAHLEAAEAYGFSLSLAPHISYSYMGQKSVPLPELEKVAEGVFSYHVGEKNCSSWNYGHNLGLTIYRKQDIMMDLFAVHFPNPNKFESRWMRCLHQGTKMLCYSKSRNVNVPLNLVQSVYPSNRHMAAFTTEELLERFEKGEKLDWSHLDHIENASSHLEAVPRFVPRVS